MPRKILISFLGTSNYLPIHYSWGENGKRVTNHRTQYVQEALATKLCTNWNKDDCIMIFRTKDALNANWLDSGKEGLNSALKRMNLKCKINPQNNPNNDDYMIETGFNETEIWQIFNCVFNKIQSGDEIYFDVTHAFRTIPIFATVLFNYARFLKHANVKGIYYGAFETLGPVYRIKDLSEEELEQLTAPIVDLTNIVRLQEINSAAAAFRDFGTMGAFSGILHDSGINELDNMVGQISEAFTKLDFYIQTCRIDDIYEGEYMQTIHNCLQKFYDSPFTNVAQHKLISEITDSLLKYGFMPDDNYCNVEAAIKWAADHNMIQQAYTLAKEYMISLAYDKLIDMELDQPLITELPKIGKIETDRNGNIKNIDFNISQTLAAIMIAYKRKIGNASFRFDERSKWNKSEVAKKLIADPYFYYISKPFKRISDRRNNLNHASTNNGKKDMESFEDYKNEFNANWEKCIDVIHGRY